MQRERFNPSSILRQHPDLERHCADGLSSIELKTKAFGIEVDLQHMLNKPLLRHQVLDRKMDDIFDLAVSTYSLLLGESLKGRYKMIINCGAYHSGCYIETKNIDKGSLLYDQLRQLKKVEPYSYDGIVMVNDKAIFKEGFIYTNRILGTKRHIDSEIFKANFFSVCMHELGHAAQIEKGVKVIASAFSEGAATFIEDVFLSGLVPMNFVPARKLVFEARDYFTGVKNLTLLGDLYSEGNTTLLLKHLDNAASIEPKHYTRHRLGEVFSMAIYLESMDLRKTISTGFEMARQDSAEKFNEAVSTLKDRFSLRRAT